MKKIVAMFLAILLVVCALPVTVSAEDSIDDYTKVSRTDVFYGYPNYLKQYNEEMRTNITTSIHSAGEQFGIDDIFFTSLETTLKSAGNFSDMFYIITDSLGITSHMSKQAADNAVLEVLKTIYQDSTSDFWNTVTSTTSNSVQALNSSFDLLDNIYAESLKDNNYSSFEQFFEDTLYRTIEQTAEFDVLIGDVSTKARVELKDSFYNMYKDEIKGAEAAIKLAKCCATILFYQNIEIELIDYMLSFSMLDEDLTASLNRIKKDISSNCLTLFLKKFTKDTIDTLINKLEANVFGEPDPVTSIVSTICNFSGWLLFDVLYDNPDATDVYSYCYMCKFIYAIQYEMNQKLNFICSDLVYSKTIDEFEYFYEIYAAIYKISYQYAKKMSDKDIVFPFEDSFFVFSNFVEYVRGKIESIEVKDRIEKTYIYDKTYNFDEPIIISNEDQDSTCIVTFHDKIMAPITIDENVKIDNCNVIIPGLNIERSLTISSSITVENDCTFTMGTDDYLYLIENGTLNIKGDAVFKRFNGDDSTSKIIIENNAEFNVEKNLIMNGTKQIGSGYNYIDLTVFGKLNVNENLETNSLVRIYDYGDIHVCGDVNFIASTHWVRVTHGYIYIYDNATFTADGDFTLQGSNYHNTGNNWFSLYLYGDLTVGGDFSATNRFVSLNQLSANSVFFVAGDMYLDVLNHTVIYGFDISTCKGYECFLSAGTLMIGGNYTNVGATITPGANHKIVLNGFIPQTINNLIAATLILDNTSEQGITFTSAINPSVLFCHNDSNYTLYNDGIGSSFVDYDGDGINDDIDPKPMAGNPCTIYFESEDVEKGAVSLSEESTIGGTEVTATAIPTSKYSLSKWVNSSGQTVSTSPQITVVATKDETYTALFVKRQHYITKEAEGGTIDAPEKAEIETEVSVSITEEAGYIYTEGSLSYNGIPIENGKFIMPNEEVTLTAEFVRNESYFELSEALTSAKSYKYESYSKDSFSVLTNAINAAQSALTNNISAEESSSHITSLQNAINSLENKTFLGIFVVEYPTIYVNCDNTLEDVYLSVVYDNYTSFEVYGTDCTFENFDTTILGDQEVLVQYKDFCDTITLTVSPRLINDCVVTEIEPQHFDSAQEFYTPVPSIIYSNTGEALCLDKDFVVEYMDNIEPGLAKAFIKGIGNYTGTHTVLFEICCDHNYNYIVETPATCLQDGYNSQYCSICKQTNFYETIITEDLPESEHDYQNYFEATYSYNYNGATSLVLNFSSKTLLEKVCEFIYIYDADNTLIGKYGNNSLAGKSVTVPGNTVYIRLVSDYADTSYGFSLDSIVAYCDDLLIPKKEHSYSGWTTTVKDGVAIKYRKCSGCGDTITEELPAVEALKFSGASLTLHNNLTVNYKVNKALFEDGGYENPYVLFELNGEKRIVKSYTVEGDNYIFKLTSIAPNQMNDTIYATLYAKYNGVLYNSETREYSIAQYCYNMLANYSGEEYAKLRTLIVDLLHYGAQSQLYTGHNTDNLVNAALTSAQLAWGTAGTPTLQNVLNTKYETVENPTAKWQGAGLLLNNAVIMKLKFTADDIKGLTVKIRTDNDEWTIKSTDFKVEDGVYYVTFDGLGAGQMSENVYLTIYKGDTAISNTARYSIESYACGKQNGTDTKLSALVNAMMNYGNSARDYN